MERVPRGDDFYDLAERERRIPEAELAIAEAALARGGPLEERALRQLRETPEVSRLRSDDGSYELRIVTNDDLRIRGVPRAGWASDMIPVETTDGAHLELRIQIHEAGIVGLSGRAKDVARWPRAWQVSATTLDQVRVRGPWLNLPTPAELKVERARAAAVIGDWLGDTDLIRGRRGILRADPAATEEILVAFESRESFRLPDAYRHLLRVADGIGIGSIDVLGTHDAYRLDIPGPARLVIAPPDEDGALVLDESGAVVWIDTDDQQGIGTVRAPDLRTWLAKRLRRGGSSRLDH